MLKYCLLLHLETGSMNPDMGVWLLLHFRVRGSKFDLSFTGVKLEKVPNPNHINVNDKFPLAL